LAREQRRALLAGARHGWRDATLLCVTHDVGETLGFERVLVVDDGRIVEDGRPAELAAGDTRYAQMLRAEAQLRHGLWESHSAGAEGGLWRTVRIEGGQAREGGAA
jgi:ATP-binding cassette subfamily B protein